MVARRVPRWSEVSELVRPRVLPGDATDRRLAAPPRSVTCGSSPAGRCPARCSTTPTAPRAPRSASAGPGRRSPGSSSGRACCATSRSSTPRPRCSAGRRPCRSRFAPTGFTRLMHTAGERAVVRVAERAGIPYGLSTMGTTSLEDVAAAAPDARRWFQLYLWRDREASARPGRAGRAAGYEALVLTVDTPVAGPRLRDVRNGFTIPPALSLRTMPNAPGTRAWWVDLLTTEPLEFASLHSLGRHGRRAARPGLRAGRHPRRPRALRQAWPGALVVKGVQTARTPWRWWTRGSTPSWCPTTVAGSWTGRPRRCEQLPDVVAAVAGRAEVHLDGGVRRRRRRGRGGRGGDERAGRPGLPVRVDGRGRARGAAGGRHPARRGGPHPAAARRPVGGRADSRSGPAGP